MEQFTTAGHLASWAGMTPGHYRSAGKSSSSRTGPGSRWLAGALGLAALSAGRSQHTYLGARYRRLAPRMGGSARTSPCSTTSSPQCGTCSPMTSRTEIPAATTTTAKTQKRPGTRPSPNSDASASTSSSAETRNHRHPTHQPPGPRSPRFTAGPRRPAETAEPTNHHALKNKQKPRPQISRPVR